MPYLTQVAFLRAVLGPQAVPCPTLNVGTSFPTIINAALGSTATSYVFSPYTDDISFELGAFLKSLDMIASRLLSAVTHFSTRPAALQAARVSGLLLSACACLLYRRIHLQGRQRHWVHVSMLACMA